MAHKLVTESMVEKAVIAYGTLNGEQLISVQDADDDFVSSIRVALESVVGDVVEACATELERRAPVCYGPDYELMHEEDRRRWRQHRDRHFAHAEIIRSLKSQGQ